MSLGGAGGLVEGFLECAEIQRDLDVFLRYDNLERPFQGYRFQGRTPAQALQETLGIEALPPATPARRGLGACPERRLTCLPR